MLKEQWARELGSEIVGLIYAAPGIDKGATVALLNIAMIFRLCSTGDPRTPEELWEIFTREAWANSDESCKMNGCLSTLRPFISGVRNA